jgi:hypothetical protein
MGRVASPCSFAFLFQWDGNLSRRSWTALRFELAVGAAIAAVNRPQTAMSEKCIVRLGRGSHCKLSNRRGLPTYRTIRELVIAHCHAISRGIPPLSDKAMEGMRDGQG